MIPVGHLLCGSAARIAARCFMCVPGCACVQRFAVHAARGFSVRATDQKGLLPPPTPSDRDDWKYHV